MKRLENKTAIITGGSGGIGVVTAARFLEEGANVTLVDLNQEALDKAVKELDAGDRVLAVKADVSSAEDTKNYIQKTIDTFGKLDIMFANAGIEGKVGSFEDYDDDTFDLVMKVNVKGVYLSIKHAIPALKAAGGGSIVVTGSITGMQATKRAVAYSTSKHAVTGLMRTAAVEVAKDKIRVNSINPSPVDGRMMRSLESGYNPKEAEAAQKNLESLIPMGRYAEASEIANLALFLASDESQFITGTVNPIDGGMTA
ncbi:SDR family oxidoreductase [Algoriphagus sp.]|uniref:SDR family NAD(P)-dependent oxidoreductase n=1 Tax=Algoriphagus sp. TaxID=1872435 RepID=UPI0032866F4D